MRTLKDDRQTTFFLAGEQFPKETNCFWIIVQGAVKTYTYNECGTPAILGFWGKGDLVGADLSNLELYNIECLSDVRAIAINSSQSETITPKILSHALQIQQLTYIVRNNRVAQRLWLLLQWLGSKFGRVIQQGNLIDFKLTHRELAEATGTTRITVTKILNQFERDGLILRPKTKCIILKELPEQ